MSESQHKRNKSFNKHMIPQAGLWCHHYSCTYCIHIAVLWKSCFFDLISYMFKNWWFKVVSSNTILFLFNIHFEYFRFIRLRPLSIFCYFSYHQNYAWYQILDWSHSQTTAPIMPCEWHCFRTCAVRSWRHVGVKAMADDQAGSSKLKTDETLEGSSSDDDDISIANGDERVEAEKTFKDLVSVLQRARQRFIARCTRSNANASSS